MRTFKDTHIYIWNPLDDVYQIVVGRVVLESDFKLHYASVLSVSIIFDQLELSEGYLP